MITKLQLQQQMNQSPSQLAKLIKLAGLNPDQAQFSDEQADRIRNAQQPAQAPKASANQGLQPIAVDSLMPIAAEQDRAAAMAGIEMADRASRTFMTAYAQRTKKNNEAIATALQGFNSAIYAVDPMTEIEGIDACDFLSGALILNVGDRPQLAGS